jgi:hypothetical protein
MSDNDFSGDESMGTAGLGMDLDEEMNDDITPIKFNNKGKGKDLEDDSMKDDTLPWSDPNFFVISSFERSKMPLLRIAG